MRSNKQNVQNQKQKNAAAGKSVFEELEPALLNYCVLCVLVRQMVLYAERNWLFTLPMEFSVVSHPLNRLSDAIAVGRRPENIGELLFDYSRNGALNSLLSKSLLDIEELNSPEYFCSGVIGCLANGYAEVGNDMVKDYCMGFYEGLLNGYGRTQGVKTYDAYVYAMKEIGRLFRESEFVKFVEKDAGNADWKKLAGLHLSFMFPNFEKACAHLADDEGFSAVVDVGRYILLGSVAAASYVSLVSDHLAAKEDRTKGNVAGLKKECKELISCVEAKLLPFLKNRRANKYGWVARDTLQGELSDFLAMLKAQQKWLEVLYKARKLDIALLVLRVRHAISLTALAENSDKATVMWVDFIARVIDVDADSNVVDGWLKKYKEYCDINPGKYNESLPCDYIEGYKSLL